MMKPRDNKKTQEDSQKNSQKNIQKKIQKDIEDVCRRRFDESIAALGAARDSMPARIAQAAGLIVDCYRKGGGVFAFGNGGSAADAEHIALELVGRFLKDRPALRAEALTAAGPLLTCLANDFGPEAVFRRQLEAAARKGDVAIALTTSGNSPNVVAGLETARRMGLKTIAFTGRGGGRCAHLADVLLEAPSRHTLRIQETHVVMYHIMCELVESRMAGGWHDESKRKEIP